MSNNEWYLEHDQKPSLHSWVFQQMALGAAYAGLFLVAVMAVVLVCVAIGKLLPEDSKFAPPPMPQIEGSLTGPADHVRTV